MVRMRLTTYLNVVILLVIGKLNVRGGLHFSLPLLDQVHVDLGLLGKEGGALNEAKVGVLDELAGEVEERLLEVVVGASRNVVVHEVLAAVEDNGLGLDLAVLDVDLVTAENNGDVLADALDVLVPVGDVTVGHTGSNVEHDDRAVTLNADCEMIVIRKEQIRFKNR